MRDGVLRETVMVRFEEVLREIADGKDEIDEQARPVIAIGKKSRA